MPAVTNQSDVDLFRRLAAYFQTGTWTYLYPRLAGSQAFLQNLNNSSGILYAYDTLGDPMYSLNYNGDNSMLIWYYTAFYANLYPLPDILQANCLQFQTYIASIENSIAASDKQYVADNNGPQHVARTIVLSNMLNQYNSYYAGLSCDTYLADQAKAEAAAANQAAVNSATQGQLAAYTATQGTTVLGIPLTTANIGIVAIVAVGIILGVVYFKKNAK